MKLSAMLFGVLFSFSAFAGSHFLAARSSTGFALYNPAANDVTLNVNALGMWSYREQDVFTAAGNPTRPHALKGYIVPGKTEGALLVRLSTGQFQVAGTNFQVTIPSHQKIAFVINDDLNSIVGNGFKDNHGELLLKWTTTDNKDVKLNIEEQDFDILD